MLPAVDDKQVPIAGTELAKISFGFCITVALTLVLQQTLSFTRVITQVNFSIFPLARVLVGFFLILFIAMFYIVNPLKYEIESST